jgi:hypothetical protein
MASGYNLYCASSLGAIDPRCLPTHVPTVVPTSTISKIAPPEVNEIFGYAFSAFAVFCIYFCILCIYKIFRGYSLMYSMKFALCRAQRFLYDRTARLSLSFFSTPVVLSVLPTPITNPTGYCTPIPMLVLASAEATSPRSPPVQVSSEMPIYSDPTDLSDRSMGVVVVVD